jgi:hypothetical protein
MKNNTLKTGLRLRNARFGTRAGRITRRQVVPLDVSLGSKSPGDFPFDEPVNNGRQLSYLSASDKPGDVARITRRLVFYTESLSPRIVSIVDNTNACPNENVNAKCQVVTAETCVFLESGDESLTVRDQLLRGIRGSIASGEFEAAIPEEYRIK